MSMIYYYQPISQPCRAVHAALLIGKVEFTLKLVDVVKGETRAPEYTAINPAQLVPAIQEGDLMIFESQAILKYLAATRPSLESFYPKDPKNQALVDNYLNWHHLGFRQTITLDYMWDSFFMVKFFGKEPPTNSAEKLLVVEEKIALFEKVFLGGEKNYKYIANQPTISIADLSAHAELSTLQFINYDFSKFPQTKAWFENISKMPEINQAYVSHNEIVKQYNPDLNDFNKLVIG